VYQLFALLFAVKAKAVVRFDDAPDDGLEVRLLRRVAAHVPFEVVAAVGADGDAWLVLVRCGLGKMVRFVRKPRQDPAGAFVVSACRGRHVAALS
jgi:hypothetical protein